MISPIAQQANRKALHATIDAAQGSAGIADSVESVANSTQFTLDSSEEINELANDLKETAQQLNALVAGYTI